MSTAAKPPRTEGPAEPQTPLDAVTLRADARRKGILAWLDKEHPEVFGEQLLTRKGTSERAYWHHGYMMALADVLRALGAATDGVRADGDDVGPGDSRSLRARLCQDPRIRLNALFCR